MKAMKRARSDSRPTAKNGPLAMKTKIVMSSMSSKEYKSEDEESEAPITVMKGTTFRQSLKKPAVAVTASERKKRKWAKVPVILEDEDDEDSDAIPQADGDKPMRKRPLGKRLASRSSVPSPLLHLDPPQPFRGWYSSVWDPELFDQQVPRLDSIVEVIVQMSNGVDSTEGVAARVDGAGRVTSHTWPERHEVHGMILSCLKYLPRVLRALPLMSSRRGAPPP